MVKDNIEEFTFKIDRVDSHLDHSYVTFNPPLEINAYKAEDGCSYFYDFGMSQDLPAFKNEFLGIKENDDWKDKVKKIVQFDLEHAFFHTSLDPNYGPIHYAILGCMCLSGRTLYCRKDFEKNEVDSIPMDWIP